MTKHRNLRRFIAKAFLTIGLIAAASIVGTAEAATPIGATTLIDDAVVHEGTVVPGALLTFLEGGRTDITGTGTANGAAYTYDGGSLAQRAAALAAIDHVWTGFDPALILTSAVPLSRVLAIPAIDHGWTPGNTEPTEAHEPFEFIIWGCDAGMCIESGRITDVYARGVDDSGPSRNADDWASVWAFSRAYSIFAVTGGDRLVGGPYSIVDGMLEGEIDALAAVSAPVPEPESYAMLFAGLGLLGIAARRRKKGAA
jgi:hypothetical protein